MTLTVSNDTFFFVFGEIEPPVYEYSINYNIFRLYEFACCSLHWSYPPTFLLGGENRSILAFAHFYGLFSCLYVTESSESKFRRINISSKNCWSMVHPGIIHSGCCSLHREPTLDHYPLCGLLQSAYLMSSSVSPTARRQHYFLYWCVGLEAVLGLV